MGNTNMSKKRILLFLLIICISLLVEIFVFNFRSYESLFFNEKFMGEFESYVENDEEAGFSRLFIHTGGERIHNIYINAGFIDKSNGKLEECSAAIAVKNVGASSFNIVAETVISSENPVSGYIFLNNKENAEQIRIDFPLRATKSIRIYEIKLNAHRPLFFSALRFLAMSATGIVIIIVCGKLKAKKDKEDKGDTTDNETEAPGT